LLGLWFEEGDVIAEAPVAVPVVVICSWEAAAVGATEEVIVSPRAPDRAGGGNGDRRACYHHRGRGRRWRAGPGAVVGIGEAPRAVRAIN
jgi:hypothetical protein